MKKRNFLLAAAMAGVLATGCGQGAESETAPAVQTTAQTTAETAVETETAAEETEPEVKETAAETEQKKETEEKAAETEDVEPASQEAESKGQAGGYEDNFAVDAEAAAEFGRQVKAAVADRDIEALADLTAYPVYVGFPDGGVSVTSREEMTGLGAERIFTEELTEAIAAADENGLSPSMAGFSLSGENGRPNIIFGVRDGELAVSGINY